MNLHAPLFSSCSSQRNTQVTNFVALPDFMYNKAQVILAWLLEKELGQRWMYIWHE